MLPKKICWFLPTLLLLVNAEAGALSDSLLIEGHFSQAGKSVTRRNLETFLLEQSACSTYIGRSKALRMSAWGIGAGLWCVNAGIMIYQVKEFVDAVQNEEPVGSNIDNLILPLAIGGEIATLIQGQLSTRSDYLLHKSATAYNNFVQEKYSLDVVLDHRVSKKKSGWYLQDRVLMPTSVLHLVLKEREASRSFIQSSMVCRGLANQTGAIGAMLIIFAVIGYIEEEGVDTRARDTQLGVGIGFTSFAIINGIVSAITRNAAIRNYNESLSEPTESIEVVPTSEGE